MVLKNHLVFIKFYKRNFRVIQMYQNARFFSELRGLTNDKRSPTNNNFRTKHLIMRAE